MLSSPLQTFAPPVGLFNVLHSSGISNGMVVEWVLYIVFTFWALYTIVAIYHWVKYSHASLVAFPAIALHLFISIALIVYAFSGTLL